MYTSSDLIQARADSVRRSRSTVSGQVIEYLAPFFPGWPAEFNPRDAEFIGKPVDFLIFDGLDQGREVNIVLVEVKPGRSNLNTNQRRVRDAIRASRVTWREVRLSTESATLPELNGGNQSTSVDQKGTEEVSLEESDQIIDWP